MLYFIKVTDKDGDVHLCNLSQLCFCDIEQRENGFYNCTMQFDHNISSFYLTSEQRNRLVNCLTEDI